MDMPLAYRIVNLERVPPLLPPERKVDRAAMAAQMTAMADAVRAVPKFRLDNVAEFYASHERAVWDCEKDIPNWAPPFPHFFVEWNEPEAWNMGGSLVRASQAGQYGFLIASLPVRDEARSNLKAWRVAMGGMVGGTGEADVPDALLSKSLTHAKWVLCLAPWASLAVAPLNGRPLWMGLIYFVFVAADGRNTGRIVSGISMPSYLAEGDAEKLWSPIHVVGLGLSFCHCKNVKVSEGKAANWSPHWDQAGKTRRPTLRFHTIDIDPMRETLRREGRSDEVGMQKALHICRGHFATYSPEHPLFGKYVGTFWKPSHVRGTADQGVVVADYAIHSTNPKETPR